MATYKICLQCEDTFLFSRKQRFVCSEECHATYITNLEEKDCRGCKTTKPVGEFNTQKGNFDTYNNYCKDCIAEKWQTWYSKDTEAKRARNSELAVAWQNTEKGQASRRNKRYKQYGLTEEQYLDMLEACNGLCEICKKRPVEAIDHDHATGLVRGLLCGTCNRALGSFEDNSQILNNAINYLNKGTS